jgi:hypothetical protein
VAVDIGQVGELEVDLELPSGVMRALSVGAPLTSTLQLFSFSAELCGWSLRETTGSAGASVDLYTGEGTNGELIASIAVASGGMSAVISSHHAIWARRGIFVNVVSGSVTGVVYYRRRKL